MKLSLKNIALKILWIISYLVVNVTEVNNGEVSILYLGVVWSERKKNKAAKKKACEINRCKISLLNKRWLSVLLRIFQHFLFKFAYKHSQLDTFSSSHLYKLLVILNFFFSFLCDSAITPITERLHPSPAYYCKVLRKFDFFLWLYCWWWCV